MAMGTNIKYMMGVAASALLLSACMASTTDKDAQQDGTGEQYDLATLTASYYDGEVLSHDLKERLDEELAKLPEVEEGTESVEVDEALTRLLSAYLDASMVNADRYDNLLSVLYTDILLTSKNEDTLAAPEVEDLDSSAVKGFWEDIDTLGLKVVKEAATESYFVQVDYDKFEEAYGLYLNEFQANNIRLQRHIQQHNFYDLANGVPDFENIHARLQLLDEIQDGDPAKDDYYWEGERYFYYAGLLGFNESTMMDTTSSLKDAASINMRQFIENNPDSPYVEDVKKIYQMMTESNTYGATTVQEANRLINERFADYITHIAQVSGGSADEGGAGAAVDADAALDGEATSTEAGDVLEIDAEAETGSESE